VSAQTTSRPWGLSGVLHLVADDGSTTGIESSIVSAHRLVPGLLLGDRSLALFAVPRSRTGAPFAVAPRLSYFLLSPNLSVVLAFFMYLHGEKLLLGPSSKAFRRVLSFLFEFCRCPLERSAYVVCSGHLVSLAVVWFSSRIPFIRERGLSSTTTYLDGRIVVLIELLTGSSSKTQALLRGPDRISW
jgi:hypothetical protein